MIFFVDREAKVVMCVLPVSPASVARLGIFVCGRIVMDFRAFVMRVGMEIS